MNGGEPVPEGFVRGMPKAELHMHIEGSLEPELMFELAERNGVSLRYGSVEDARRAYDFGDLQSFLDLYYEGMRVLVRERDFYDLTRAYLHRAAAAEVRRAEIFFDPQAHTARGVAYETVLDGISSALREVGGELGVSCGLIMCFLRHLGPEAAMEAWEAALPRAGELLGVGLDSTEVGYPPEPFREVYERARAEGLHAVAHAGEEGPSAYIWGALDALGAERIDHGVHCMEDVGLVARLRDESTPLTVCPLSNLRLRGVERMEDHPLKRMLDAGLRVSVNSDDPAYFGGYVDQNFVAAGEALGLTRDDVYTLARNSFTSAFVQKDEMEGYVQQLDAYFDAHPTRGAQR